MHSEMEFVRKFLRANFGEVAVEQGNSILLRLFDEQKRLNATNPYAFRDVIRQSCEQIAMNLDYGQRLQLLNFLVMIAMADGSMPNEEISALRECVRYMRMDMEDLDSMLNLQKTHWKMLMLCWAYRLMRQTMKCARHIVILP